jgi:iron complex transport system permease protein
VTALKKAPAVTASFVLVCCILGAVAVGTTILFAICIGPTPLSPGKMISWVMGQEVPDPTERTILMEIRLPRVLLTGLVGALLSVCGAVLQALLMNPLAEPFVLGISSGAALGALSSMVLGVGLWSMGTSTAAFLGAVGTIVLVLALAGERGRVNMTRLLLTGVIVNAFFTSMIMLLVSLSRTEQLHSVLFWLYGDLSGARYDQIWLMGASCLGGLVLFFGHARALNLMGLGEQVAEQLGVQVRRSRTLLIGVTSLLTALAVSSTGLIGFVGLIVPHLMRMALGADHRVLIPTSALGGAIFLIIADALARTIVSPSEVPVGVITAALGAPFFILLLRAGGNT